MSEHGIFGISEDPFGIGTADIVLQGTNYSENMKSVDVVGSGGDFIGDATQWFGHEGQISAEYILISGALTLSGGGMYGDYILTGISLRQVNTNYPTLSLSGHKHISGVLGGNPDHQSRVYLVTVSGGWGVVNDYGVSGIEPTGSNLSIALNHVDIDDRNGEHFDGISIQGRRNISVDGWINASGTITYPTTALDTKTTRSVNSNFQTASCAFHEAIAAG